MVRRVGVYTYLAAFCLILMEVTVLGLNLKKPEWMIAILALTALAANFIQSNVSTSDRKLSRAAPLWLWD